MTGDSGRLCRRCKAPMVPAPNHPGKELGDWFTHPPVPYAELLGHDHSHLVPRDQHDDRG